MWVAIDFDHTLVDGDTMLPGARDALIQLRDLGYKILIHSCNRPEWIREVLDAHDAPYDKIWDQKGKPNCDVYVDDRAVGFAGDWTATLEDIKNVEERRNAFIERV